MKVSSTGVSRRATVPVYNWGDSCSTQQVFLDPKDGRGSSSFDFVAIFVTLLDIVVLHYCTQVFLDPKDGQGSSFFLLLVALDVASHN